MVEIYRGDVVLCDLNQVRVIDKSRIIKVAHSQQYIRLFYERSC